MRYDSKRFSQNGYPGQTIATSPGKLINNEIAVGGTPFIAKVKALSESHIGIDLSTNPIAFDGVDDFFYLYNEIDSTPYNFKDLRSISFWGKIDMTLEENIINNDISYRFFNLGSYAVNNWIIFQEIKLLSGGRVFRMSLGDGTYTRQASISIPNGFVRTELHNYTMIFSENGWKLYIDGVLNTFSSDASLNRTPLDSLYTTANIGTSVNSYSNYGGELGNFIFSEQEFEQAEVSALYNEGVYPSGGVPSNIDMSKIIFQHGF